MDKETGVPAKIKHEETMIPLREWHTERGQIKQWRGIWLLSVPNCCLKPPFFFPFFHLNLSPRYVTLSAGRSRPIRQCLSCLRPQPGAPCYLKLKRKTVLLIIWNRHIPLSDTILYSSQLSRWALSSGITWLIFSTAFAGWLNYATCHMFPLSTACGLMGPGGLAHIYAATQVRVPGMW